MEKSLNQQWKESGTTLSYKEWRRREDEKMASFDGVTQRPSLRDTVMASDFDKKREELNKLGGYQKDISGETTLGIKKYVIIGFAAIIVIAVGYKIYKSRKS